jgi:hypothetical protein
MGAPKYSARSSWPKLACVGNVGFHVRPSEAAILLSAGPDRARTTRNIRYGSNAAVIQLVKSIGQRGVKLTNL